MQSKTLQKLLKEVENEYKGAIKEIKTDYKIDLNIYGYTKGEDVWEFLQGLEFNDYENLAWFAGYLRGINLVINTIKSYK